MAALSLFASTTTRVRTRSQILISFSLPPEPRSAADASRGLSPHAGVQTWGNAVRKCRLMRSQGDV